MSSSGVAKEGFAEVDSVMYERAQRDMKRRHPRKSGWWRTQKYPHSTGFSGNAPD
jgi:hypothetical protein